VVLALRLTTSGRERGSPNDRPARIDRAEPSRARLRRERLAEERRLVEAAVNMSAMDLDAEVLDEAQLAVLLRLLDLALSARTTGAPRAVAAAAHGVRLEFTPWPGYTQVTTKQGRLRLDGYALRIIPAEHTAAST
jgi:hypothetical protein